jgi:hypothetical protein
MVRVYPNCRSQFSTIFFVLFLFVFFGLFLGLRKMVFGL